MELGSGDDVCLNVIFVVRLLIKCAVGDESPGEVFGGSQTGLGKIIMITVNERAVKLVASFFRFFAFIQLVPS